MREPPPRRAANVQTRATRAGGSLARRSGKGSRGRLETRSIFNPNQGHSWGQYWVQRGPQMALTWMPSSKIKVVLRAGLWPNETKASLKELSGLPGLTGATAAQALAKASAAVGKQKLILSFLAPESLCLYYQVGKCAA